MFHSSQNSILFLLFRVLSFFIAWKGTHAWHSTLNSSNAFYSAYTYNSFYFSYENDFFSCSLLLNRFIPPSDIRSQISGMYNPSLEHEKENIYEITHNHLLIPVLFSGGFGFEFYFLFSDAKSLTFTWTIPEDFTSDKITKFRQWNYRFRMKINEICSHCMKISHFFSPTANILKINENWSNLTETDSRTFCKCV